MKILPIVLLLFFCGFSESIQAQYDEGKEGFAFRYIAPNHQYTVDKELIKSDFGSGLEFEYLRHINEGLNLSLPFRLSQVKISNDLEGGLSPSSNIGLDALLHLKYCQEPKFIYPHVFTGLGVVLRDLNEFDFELPLGVGLNFRLSRHLYFSTKGEYRLGFEDNENHIQLGAGFLVLVGEASPKEPEVTDRDGDNIPDAEDLCPDAAGPAGLNGCPDADGDMVPDGEDECPAVAGLAALSGCPDSDGDGVADREDECPDQFGLAENGGCPDLDGDGISDDSDDCPDQPGPVATRGCPDADGDGIQDQDDRCPDAAGPLATQGCPDSDNDGIIDEEDRCPETAGPAVNNGCPEIEEEDRETLDLAMSAVQFETANATLKTSSSVILDQIADIMNRYTDYKLRINGHTDSIGSSSPNQSLSERRAKACYDYLLGKGISADRMSYQGYGESRPIADNRYRAGREKNRRVEFDLYLE